MVSLELHDMELNVQGLFDRVVFHLYNFLALVDRLEKHVSTGTLEVTISH